MTGTDCISSSKSNYHAITTTTAPFLAIVIHVQSNLHITVKPVYKDHSREPGNGRFMRNYLLSSYRFKLYALFINGKIRLPFIESDFFFIEVPLKAGLAVFGS